MSEMTPVSPSSGDDSQGQVITKTYRSLARELCVVRFDEYKTPANYTNDPERYAQTTGRVVLTGIDEKTKEPWALIQPSIREVYVTPDELHALVRYYAENPEAQRMIQQLMAQVGMDHLRSIVGDDERIELTITLEDDINHPGFTCPPEKWSIRELVEGDVVFFPQENSLN